MKIFSSGSFSLRPIALALLWAPLCGLATGAWGQEAPAPVVEVTRAVAADSRAVEWVSGTLLSRSDARIAAEEAGRLVSVAEVGDTVGRRSGLARIDDRALQLQLRRDQASLRGLEANLAYLQTQVERLETLTSEQVAARNQLDEVAARRAVTEQEVELARAVEAETRDRLDRTVVKAPFSGRVVERFKQPGEYVRVGDDLVRLVDTKRIEVRARAPLDAAANLQKGLEVVVRSGDREAVASLRTVVPVGDERSRLLEVRAVFPEERAPEGWIVGAGVRLALPQGTPASGGVSIPRDALVLRDGKTWVFRIGAGGHAERLGVETGQGAGEWIGVSSNSGELQVGDRIIVRGAERLRPGQKVTIKGES